jgi:TRAP-type C4-dicarboxylate transport system permease small subunit
MRAALDGLYRLALWLAAACLVIIALLVGLQLGGRFVDGALKLAGVLPYGLVIFSLDEIAGYLLAAARFLALAATLKAGAHIRVTMVLAAFGEGRRRHLEIWALAAAAAFSAYITWHLGSFAYYSWKFHEVSHGLIPVPLAIPQAAMVAGILVLTIAFLDELVIVLRGGRPTFRTAEDALTLGKEG